MSICENHDDTERIASLAIDPVGFHLRAPPPPHKLDHFITPDAQLFETIHMGTSVVDASRWCLVIDGLFQTPLTLSLADLRRLPESTVTASTSAMAVPCLRQRKRCGGSAMCSGLMCGCRHC